MAKKKQKHIQIMVDEELRQQAHEYAKKHGFSLGALIRALLRIQTDPNDPRLPPPGIEEERKRPSRRKPWGLHAEWFSAPPVVQPQIICSDSRLIPNVVYCRTSY